MGSTSSTATAFPLAFPLSSDPPCATDHRVSDRCATDHRVSDGRERQSPSCSRPSHDHRTSNHRVQQCRSTCLYVCPQAGTTQVTKHSSCAYCRLGDSVTTRLHVKRPWQ